jgi:hypothetical protein
MQRINLKDWVIQLKRPGEAVIVIALVALAAIAFGLTGGGDDFKNWLFSVEVNGESAEISIDDQHGGTLSVEIEEREPPEDAAGEGVPDNLSDGVSLSLPDSADLAESVGIQEGISKIADDVSLVNE